MESYKAVQLQGVDEYGFAPLKRIRDASVARDNFRDLLNAYIDGRGKMNTLIKGNLDGNPPFPQREMDELGLQWCSNLNFRLLEADITAATIPSYTLFREVPQFITCDVDYGPVNERAEYARILCEEHKRLMDSWQGFDYGMQQSIKGRKTFGSGPLYFPNEDDFRFRYAPEGKIFTPSLTSLDTDEMEILYIMYDECVSELWQTLNNSSAACAGWNPFEIKKLLIKYGGTDFGSGYSPNLLVESSMFENYWEDYQRKIRHNDLGLSLRVPPLRLCHMFIREFSNKISHGIFAIDDDSNEYLFFRLARFNSWKQIIHPMFDEVGDGYWAGVKGLGVKSFNFRDTQNRLKNRFIDAGTLASQIVIQPETPEAEDEFQAVPIGPFAKIPAGVKYFQNPLAASIDKPIAIDNMLERDLSRNISGYRTSMVQPSSGNPITARQASLDATARESLSLQQTNQTLSQMDVLYAEQMSRMTRNIIGNLPWQKMVKDFQYRCVLRGFPREAFSKVINVKAYRPIGQGSRVERNQILAAIMQYAPLMPDNVKQRVLRELLASLAGQTYLDRLWPREELNIGPTSDEAEAQLKNSLFLQKMQPFITDKQNHLSHAQIHTAFIGSIVNGLKQQIVNGAGADVLLAQAPQMLMVAEAASPHIQQHIALQQKDPTRNRQTQAVFNAFQQVYAIVTQIAQQYNAALRAAMKKQSQQQSQPEQQAIQQGPTPEQMDQRIKDLQVQAEEQRKNFKLQSEIQRENIKLAAELEREKAKTNQEMQIKQQKASE